jgi:peptidoglycan/LPS O-acetylase OafA/YrhL
MPQTSNPGSTHHFGYLDAARGIAAIMVMVGHFANWTYSDTMRAKVASVIFNGSDAVSFFFVLSGFVLSYKYINSGASLDVRQYYVNRLFRLWPAFFIAVFINALAVLARTGIDFHSFTDMFLFNKSIFWEEAILFWARPNYFGPGWTLTTELALSFFLPFAIVLAKKDIRLVACLAFVFFLFGTTQGCGFHAHFMLGVLASTQYKKITSSSFKQTSWHRYRYLLLAIAIVLFTLRQVVRISPLGSTLVYLSGYTGISFFQYSGAASMIFLVFLLQSATWQRLLSNKFMLFLGKISYGIYLMHWVFVTNIFFYWKQLYPLFPNYATAFLTLFLLYVIITIITATILHYMIELPLMRMGKRITRKMAPSIEV